MVQKSGITYARLSGRSALPGKPLKSPFGDPTGGLSARARDAGGKALPAPQAESRTAEVGSRVRSARDSVCHRKR